MRGTWTIAGLVGVALLIAGFIAWGIARVAGLPDSGPRSLIVASAAPGIAVSPPAASKTDVSPSAMPAAMAPAELPAAPAPSVVPTEPAGTAEPPVATESATPPPAAQPEVSAPVPVPQSPAVKAPAPAVRNVAARRVATAAAEPAKPAFSAAQMRDAQCSSLRAWLAELDAVALHRTDAASQAWVQSQRSTTAERQSELRC